MGEFKIWATKRTDPGTYELYFINSDGNEIKPVLKIKVV